MDRAAIPPVPDRTYGDAMSELLITGGLWAAYLTARGTGRALGLIAAVTPGPRAPAPG
jgi:hypothetical protein